jgi:hypothetical protein
MRGAVGSGLCQGEQECFAECTVENWKDGRLRGQATVGVSNLAAIFFETESSYVSQAGLQLMMLLPPPPKYWDYTSEPLCSELWLAI